MPIPSTHPGDRTFLALSILLLAGAGTDRLNMRPSRDATEYHTHVRAVAGTMPLEFGPWRGSDCAEPAEAIDMLKPNVLISRSFENSLTGHRAMFLLVQCSDVRDMISHFPPICYPNRGLMYAASPQQIDWDVDDLKVHGTEYQFESASFENSEMTIVDNFMVLPDGRIVADMDGVKTRLKLDVRYFGAAQVQIVFTGATPPEERKQTCRELIKAHRKLIDVIRSGVR